MAYDPYAIANQPKGIPEYNERGDSVNGYTGSKTSASMRNAAIQGGAPSKGGNVFAEMVQYGRRPMGMNAGVGRVGTAGRTGVGMRGAGVPAQPANPFASPMDIGRSTTYDNPASGGTTHTNPGAVPSANPFGQMSTFNERRDYRMRPDGTVSDTSSFGNAPPMFSPFGTETRTYRQNPDGAISDTSSFGTSNLIREKKQINPGAFAPPTPPQSGFGNPFGGAANSNMVAQDEGGNSGFNPGGPPLPRTTPRPPMTPSTQPPTTSRPPTRPSTQPPPETPEWGSPGAREVLDWRGVGNLPPTNTPDFGSPGAREVLDWRGVGNLPPQGSPSNVPGSGTTTTAPQYDMFGNRMGTGDIGRRYKPFAGPVEELGASGERAQNYAWSTDPTTGRRTQVKADWNGNPIQQNTPAGGSNTGTTGGGGGGTGSTTGTFLPPNNSTTFDPNVLPSSNVGDWLDPIAQNALDQVRRQAMHAGSLTGATNSGGFVPGLTEELGNVANQFAAKKGDLQFADQQAKADRLLDKYKFDNTQQLTQWIEQNRNELEKYGIDTGALVSRYQADMGYKSAQAGARASQAAARYGADSSRYNADLDFMSQIYGTDAASRANRDRLGFDYYDSENRYNLGLYGTDAQREASMMDYLSRIYGLGPDYLRLMMGGDPSQLIPGMAPGNSVTIF